MADGKLNLAGIDFGGIGKFLLELRTKIINFQLRSLVEKKRQHSVYRKNVKDLFGKFNLCNNEETKLGFVNEPLGRFCKQTEKSAATIVGMDCTIWLIQNTVVSVFNTLLILCLSLSSLK